jgi:processive 1,2-diacylglycerol beta-glucosyltransferase
MNARVLILTAGFGEGHNAAARALAAAVDDLHGAGASRVLDVFAVARPRTNAFVRRAYLSLINRAPHLWRHAYAWLDRSPHAPRLFGPLGREVRVLEEVLATTSPEVICSTYPLYAFMLARLARASQRPLPPHFNVVTDSISINSLWHRVPCAGWFVPNADSAEVLHAAGLPPERVHALGFPVAPVFAAAAERHPPPPPYAWSRPRILYIINSGTRGAATTAYRLLEHEEWDITCTVGRNDTLRSDLRAFAARRRNPAQILGWTQEIPRLLMSHHVVVSKAGGATTQEALAAGCPMVVNQIVPGQEEGNYELLRRHGIGALAATPEAVIATLRDAFANDAAIWCRWRREVENLSRPDAARDIVRALGLAPSAVAAAPAFAP